MDEEHVPHAGRLIVATAALGDPNFRRTVVLILQRDDEGALGLVLNRPSGSSVEDAVEGWTLLAGTPPVVFVGGPVEPDALLGLVELRPEADGGPWQRIVGGLGLVDLREPPDAVTSGVQRGRLFVGYAGWGESQLEEEVDAGAWFVTDAAPDDVFTGDPDHLWQRLLRRQGPMYRHFPDEPARN